MNGLESCDSDGSPIHYSDSSSDVPSMIPTTVLEFQNTQTPRIEVNQDGPYLKIVEQPQSKFRFRYKSEMIGTHGQLKAESSNKNCHTYPTVKLENWDRGPVLIRLSLFTAGNFQNRKKHVHELFGKNVNTQTAAAELYIDSKQNYTAKFQNLCIIHIAKREVQNIINKRLHEEMITHAMQRNPNQTREQIVQRITPVDTKSIEKRAEEEYKTMDLNKVVLRFQAFCPNTLKPITHSVDSDPVMNQKNASTGELKIVRMSHCSAPCSGGTEVWILVEKVKKNNIKIKFYEEDENDKIIWSDYGAFSDGDVHHQYAIVFKTPSYRNTNLLEPVTVKVQLERPTDKDLSEPQEFKFLPVHQGKRSSPCHELKLEDSDDYQIGNIQNRKRMCPSYQKLDLSPPVRPSSNENILTDTNGVLNMITTNQNGYQNGNFFQTTQTNPQSPPFIVPSPIAPPADSPSNQQWYSPPHNTPAITIHTSDELLQLQNNYISMTNAAPFQTIISTSNDIGISSPHYQSSLGGNLSPNQNLGSPIYQEAGSPVGVVPVSPGLMEFKASPTHLLDLQSQQFSQQPQQLQSEYIHRSQQHFLTKTDELNVIDNYISQEQQQEIQPTSDNINGNRQNNYSSNNMDVVNLLSCDKFTTNDMAQFMDNMDTILNCNIGFSTDIQTDYAGKKDKKPNEPKKTPDVDDLTNKMADIKVDEIKEIANATTKYTAVSTVNDDTKSAANVATAADTDAAKIGAADGVKPSRLDMVYKIAVHAAECLQAYAATGDINILLSTHRYLIGAQNNQGDNALHTAITNTDWNAFDKILKACERVKPLNLINATNGFGETALHLAVRGNEPYMVTRLMTTGTCDIASTDINGNTAVHLAAMQNDFLCLGGIFNSAKENLTVLRKTINLFNNDGETPFHMAAIAGNVKNLNLLQNAGSNVHACEKKRGANALHLTIMHKKFAAAVHLIKNTDITVNARMFDGNTALHLAVLSKNADMCRTLIEANADPYVKNHILKNQKTEQDENGDSENSENEDSESDDENENDENSTHENEYLDKNKNSKIQKKIRNVVEYYTPLDYAKEDSSIKDILMKSSE